jgi:hypothetical protein
MSTTTVRQIDHRFTGGVADLDSLIAPLVEVAMESPSLIVGYGYPQSGLRRDMIPYFHVCGRLDVAHPVRILVAGGWHGGERTTPYAVAKMLAVFEARLQLVNGLEVTAYPVANLDAFRDPTLAALQQRPEELQCWENSKLSHIQILERELGRYPYDIIFQLRENVYARDTDIEAWIENGPSRAIMEGAFRRYGMVAPEMRWRINPARPVYRRSFTPVPDTEWQPAEIVLGLSQAQDPVQQSNELIAVVLSITHAMRQAREEGLV